VGGTGVVTIGAILAMAAHLDGKGAGMMEMAGLAQKGGAVWVHCRLAERPEDISAIRVATGECDALVGGDLVVSAGAKTLGLLKPGSAGAVVNSHEIITGAFTRNPEFRIPATGSASRSRRASASGSSCSTPPSSRACSWAIRSTRTCLSSVRPGSAG
jgi:indolepyruvate ferredoxin oxidoreductase